MPVYEYRCRGCEGKVSVFFRGFSDTKTPLCDQCGSTELTRLISRVVVMKSWGSSVNFPGADALDAADENDPAQMEGWMRRIKQELGDPAPTLNEWDKLDAGIAPGSQADDDPGSDEGGE